VGWKKKLKIDAKMAGKPTASLFSDGNEDIAAPKQQQDKT